MSERENPKSQSETGQHSVPNQSRRDFLKGSGVVAGGLAVAAVPGLVGTASAQTQQQDSTEPPPSQNPYGARPGGGISLPEYYKPWPAIKNRNMYLPGTEILLAVGRFDPAHMVLQHNGHEHHHGHGALGSVFQTWSFESDRPFSLEALRQVVRKELPASIYRCKGIVHAAGYPDKRLTLQVVGRRTEICELDEWGDRTPRSQIVAIGESGGLDAQELSRIFDACIE